MLEIERNIFQIFPINIFIERNFLSNDQCNSVLKILEKEETLKHSMLTGDSSSSFFSNNRILKKISKCIDGLESKIQERIDYLTNVSNICPCEITNSWFNIQNEESQLYMHAHGYSVMSGALYVKADESSSDLVFLNPNYNAFSIEYINQNPTTLSVKPESGTLVIFPSYLAHGSWTYQNNSNKRIVISFNSSLVQHSPNKVNKKYK